MLTASILLTLAGIVLWGWALLRSPLPPYLDLQDRQLVRILAGLAALVAAGVCALIRWFA